MTEIELEGGRKKGRILRCDLKKEERAHFPSERGKMKMESAVQSRRVNRGFVISIEEGEDLQRQEMHSNDQAIKMPTKIAMDNAHELASTTQPADFTIGEEVLELTTAVDRGVEVTEDEDEEDDIEADGIGNWTEVAIMPRGKIVPFDTGTTFVSNILWVSLKRLARPIEAIGANRYVE